MSLDSAYSLLLMTALAVMMAQTLFRPLRLEHILMAVLCGSLAMVALQTLTSNTNGIYPYLFALGTCATCNVVWLVSRAMFRGSESITTRHYLFAGIIALLVITNRSVELLVSVQWLEASGVEWLTRTVSKVTQFLSSTVLALAFWESVRNFSSDSKAGQYQRTLFASAFFIGVFSCTVIAQGVLTPAESLVVKPWLVVMSALGIIFSTFVVLIWQHRARTALIDKPTQNHPQVPRATESLKQASSESAEDIALLLKINDLMQLDKVYLRHDLKMIDLANLLGVSEYKISRVIRNQTDAANFNSYINRYRINHAENLLTAEASRHWTVLVIGLESGFASQAPFNRAFKTQEGCTPNQYRLKNLNDNLNQAEPLAN